MRASVLPPSELEVFRRQVEERKRLLTQGQPGSKGIKQTRRPMSNGARSLPTASSQATSKRSSHVSDPASGYRSGQLVRQNAKPSHDPTDLVRDELAQLSKEVQALQTSSQSQAPLPSTGRRHGWERAGINQIQRDLDRRKRELEARNRVVDVRHEAAQVTSGRLLQTWCSSASPILSIPSANTLPAKPGSGADPIREVPTLKQPLQLPASTRSLKAYLDQMDNISSPAPTTGVDVAVGTDSNLNRWTDAPRESHLKVMEEAGVMATIAPTTVEIGTFAAASMVDCGVGPELNDQDLQPQPHQVVADNLAEEPEGKRRSAAADPEVSNEHVPLKTGSEDVGVDWTVDVSGGHHHLECTPASKHRFQMDPEGEVEIEAEALDDGSDDSISLDSQGPTLVVDPSNGEAAPSVIANPTDGQSPMVDPGDKLTGEPAVPVANPEEPTVLPMVDSMMDPDEPTVSAANPDDDQVTAPNVDLTAGEPATSAERLGHESSSDESAAQAAEFDDDTAASAESLLPYDQVDQADAPVGEKQAAPLVAAADDNKVPSSDDQVASPMELLGDIREDTPVDLLSSDDRTTTPTDRLLSEGVREVQQSAAYPDDTDEAFAGALSDPAPSEVPVCDEQATPDQATPEHATPDQATPDQATTDQATPDQATPDQATPDQATTPAQALGDATVPCSTHLRVPLGPVEDPPGRTPDQRDRPLHAKPDGRPRVVVGSGTMPTHPPSSWCNGACCDVCGHQVQFHTSPPTFTPLPIHQPTHWTRDEDRIGERWASGWAEVGAQTLRYHDRAWIVHSLDHAKPAQLAEGTDSRTRSRSAPLIVRSFTSGEWQLIDRLGSRSVFSSP
eukprot:NODE_273_length_2781_cov_76.481189_g257_i0.p1 GENE.NODE_273_length_2781_cov_76.481189_g257_i0~~NODE_273_length_2781_cov_76.481189_g257_i0.p1  ORF type:complete len:846 (+),score=134.45 NODE_273_length_2781_cov_76.481189_g257_i0:96-2633(+)